MFRSALTACLTFAVIGFSTGAAADGDDHTMFVAASGIDSGACHDATVPCQTIDYALRRVGKNGHIRVAEGSYTLAAVEDYFYMVSGAINVRGGYRVSDRFTIEASATSTLVGVPQEYAYELTSRGFNVIVDSKGLDPQTQDLVDTQQSLAGNTAATLCSGGFADVFPCTAVDLLAHIADHTNPGNGADVWGFMDLNTNREYAIVGYNTGTAVFDVTDAENPREVGFIIGSTTSWRDIKIHQFWNTVDGRWNAYAYVTADSSSDGLFIIDLSELPHRVARISYSSDFAAAHNLYLTNTEYSTGLSLTGDSPTLVLAGSNRRDGRFRSYSLVNPASPAFIAAPTTPANQPPNDRLYMHDAASMIVADARKDSQCVNASGSTFCEVLFDFNEGSVDIWDVTNSANPIRLSQTSYTNVDYVHAGWWSEDKQYMFVQDETDELDRGLFTTLRVFSIADLTAPTLAGTWTGPTNAIDHNGFARGNRYYMSNYARGLTILDISDAASPSPAGRFDTYPSSDRVGFPGNWGVYPFLPSGNIALSDIDSGFYMVADRTLDVAQGSLSFTASAFGNSETQSIDIVVQRSGGSLGAASVNWEVIGATGSMADVTTTSGTLNWASGDASDLTINLGLTDDGVTEGLERLLIKLSAPSGGATLSSPSIASAYISDPTDTPVVEFSNASISINEVGNGTAIAIIKRTGSAIGAVSVDFTLSNGDAVNGADFTGPASGTLAWADGDADPKWIEYEIVDDGSAEADEFMEVTLGNVSGAAIGAVAQLRINILDGSATNDPPIVRRGGGSPALWLLGLLLGLCAVRLATTRTDGS